MLRVDAPITQEHWKPIFDVIVRNFQKGNYEKLLGKPVYKMLVRGPWGHTNWIYVLARKPHGTFEIQGWLFLAQKTNWNCWEVAQSYIFTAWRGRGLGTKLYSAVIHDDVLLASGNQQSKTGRAMWKSLIKSDKFNIWAHDFSNLEIFGPVTYDPETDELWSELEIYERTFWEANDIRLLALRK